MPVTSTLPGMAVLRLVRPGTPAAPYRVAAGYAVCGAVLLEQARLLGEQEPYTCG
jgi:hypothetical protein